MDLIQKFRKKGFTPINNKYILWEGQKWLREKHSIYIIISSENNSLFLPDDKFGYAIKFNRGYDAKNPEFKLYEQALEEALLQALKLIK